MSGLLNSINTWRTKSPAPKPVNGDKEPRGTKRKAKGDPYDDIDDDSVQKKTPSNQRTRSRISSEIPSPAAKSRPSSSAKTNNKRRSRSMGARKNDITDAAANLARAQEPEAARLQPQEELEDKEQEGNLTKSSMVPVADMGVPDLSSEDNASTAVPHGDTTDHPKSNGKTPTKVVKKGKAKATATEPEEDEVHSKPNGIAEAEEHEVHAILEHRMAKDRSGRIEVLIHWAGEGKEEATWEPEDEIQRGAEDVLYAYWKKQGGRMNALFIKPKNAPTEIYHVFKILQHKKKNRGGFEMEVQWVGHPATGGETSWESETKMRKVAPDGLKEYWESVGGRDKFLAKRGRAKKQRTE